MQWPWTAEIGSWKGAYNLTSWVFTALLAQAYAAEDLDCVERDGLYVFGCVWPIS